MGTSITTWSVGLPSSGFTLSFSIFLARAIRPLTWARMLPHASVNAAFVCVAARCCLAAAASSSRRPSDALRGGAAPGRSMTGELLLRAAGCCCRLGACSAGRRGVVSSAGSCGACCTCWRCSGQEKTCVWCKQHGGFSTYIRANKYTPDAWGERERRGSDRVCLCWCTVRAVGHVPGLTYSRSVQQCRDTRIYYTGKEMVKRVFTDRRMDDGARVRGNRVRARDGFGHAARQEGGAAMGAVTRECRVWRRVRVACWCILTACGCILTGRGIGGRVANVAVRTSSRASGSALPALA